MVCGSEGESERSVPSRVIDGGYYCRAITNSEGLVVLTAR
jgi:hypothetical protein